MKVEFFKEDGSENLQLEKFINTTLENGTLLAMHIDMNNGEIYLDDNLVGAIYHTNGEPVDKDSIINMMVQNFSNFVKDLFNKFCK